MSKAATATGPNFRYWNSVDPAHFLEHDWQNPSRPWAAERAIEAALRAPSQSLLEIGPGPGVDYARVFSKAAIRYLGVEGSATLYEALRSRFPEAEWRNLTIADLAPLSADVVYARHVLEHQPALEPALGQVLAAARSAVVLTWYRPPGPVAVHEVWEGVDCRTYRRADVFEGIARAGFRLTECQGFFGGDEGWVLERT